MRIANTLPELIGHPPLLRLERFAPGGGLLAKLESFNPLSSAKDRAGLYMIRDAEARGLLKPGAVIVEPTSGNTGVALAYIGRLRGYRVVLTMPETMSAERRALLAALGAELVLTDASGAELGTLELQLSEGSVTDAVDNGDGTASLTVLTESEEAALTLAMGDGGTLTCSLTAAEPSAS